PFIGIFFGISRVCLIGFPFTCGFYSKDLILEGGLFSEYFYFSYILFLLSCILTVIYRLRLFNLGYLNILIRMKLVNIIEYKINYNKTKLPNQKRSPMIRNCWRAGIIQKPIIPK